MISLLPLPSGVAYCPVAVRHHRMTKRVLMPRRGNTLPKMNKAQKATEIVDSVADVKEALRLCLVKFEEASLSLKVLI